MLDAGDPARTADPRRRRVTLTIALVLLLLAGAAWWVDQSRVEREGGQLSSCVRSAESTAATAEGRVAMMREYVRPVIGNADETTQRGLYALVREQAQVGLPAYRRVRDTCADVPVSAWHEDLRRARTAYLTYLDTRLGLLESIARDGGRDLRVDAGEIPRLREAAFTALRGAGLSDVPDS